MKTIERVQACSVGIIFQQQSNLLMILSPNYLLEICEHAKLFSDWVFVAEPGFDSPQS